MVVPALTRGVKGSDSEAAEAYVRVRLSLLGPVSWGFEGQPGCSWSGARQGRRGQAPRTEDCVGQGDGVGLGWSVHRAWAGPDGALQGPGAPVCGRGGP